MMPTLQFLPVFPQPKRLASEVPASAAGASPSLSDCKEAATIGLGSVLVSTESDQRDPWEPRLCMETWNDLDTLALRQISFLSERETDCKRKNIPFPDVSQRMLTRLAQFRYALADYKNKGSE